MSEAANPVTPRVMWHAILCAVLSQALSFFLFSPALWMAPNGRFTNQYEPLTHQPWTDAPLESPQTRHRILAPTIAYALQLHGLASAFVPIVGGTIMLMLTYLVVTRHIEERWASWATVLVATTQTLISSQTWIGYQDTFGGAAIMACFLTRTPWFAAAYLFLGMLAEERCAVAIPFILLWHVDLAQPRPWKTVSLWVLALFVAVVAWAGYYYYATQHFLSAEQRATYNLGGTSFRQMMSQLNYLALGYFQSIRGAWIIIGYVGYLLLQRSSWLAMLIGLVGILGCLVQAGIVADISRSTAMLWPIVLLCLREMKRHDTGNGLFLLKTIVFFNLLTPCYQVVGSSVQYYFPLPISLSRWLFNF